MEILQGVVQAGKKERKHVRIQLDLYMNGADDWIDKVGEKPFCTWIKLHSWVNRRDDRLYHQHVPYTFESLIKKWLKVSKATFYRLIKPLWEYGLIDIVEFEQEKEGTNPRNLIVYEYPLNDINRKYEPLEKLRDWEKDYDSISKQLGKKGGLMSKLSTKNKGGNKNETPSENVDNSNLGGLKNETLGGLKNETPPVSKMKPNKVLNKESSLNKINHVLNNSFLSQLEIDLVNDILTQYDYVENEREYIISLINEKQIKINKSMLIAQCKFMIHKQVHHRPLYFVNGLEMTQQRSMPVKEETTSTENYQRKVPFYNWLEN